MVRTAVRTQLGLLLFIEQIEFAEDIDMWKLKHEHRTQRKHQKRHVARGICDVRGVRQVNGDQLRGETRVRTRQSCFCRRSRMRWRLG